MPPGTARELMPPGPQLVYDAQSQPNYPGAKPLHGLTLALADAGHGHSPFGRSKSRTSPLGSTTTQ